MKIRKSYKYQKLKVFQQSKRENKEDLACKELMQISNYDTFEQAVQLRQFINSQINPFRQNNFHKLHTSDVSFNYKHKINNKFPKVNKPVKNKLNGKQVFIGQSIQKIHTSIPPTQYLVFDSRTKIQNKIKTNNLQQNKYLKTFQDIMKKKYDIYDRNRSNTKHKRYQSLKIYKDNHKRQI